MCICVYIYIISNLIVLDIPVEGLLKLATKRCLCTLEQVKIYERLPVGMVCHSHLWWFLGMLPQCGGFHKWGFPQIIHVHGLFMAYLGRCVPPIWDLLFRWGYSPNIGKPWKKWEALMWTTGCHLASNGSEICLVDQQRGKHSGWSARNQPQRPQHEKDRSLGSYVGRTWTTQWRQNFHKFSICGSVRLVLISSIHISEVFSVKSHAFLVKSPFFISILGRSNDVPSLPGSFLCGPCEWKWSRVWAAEQSCNLRWRFQG